MLFEYFMLNTICGFFWGILCTVFVIDLVTSVINISWLIYIPLFILLLIGSLALKVYLYVTDYKEMASTGFSIIGKLITYIKNKKVNNTSK